MLGGNLKREKYVPGVLKRSGNATPGVESVGVPLVFGDLTSLAGFREEVGNTHLLTKREISFLAWDCQFEALRSAVRIIRRHLSNE